MARSLVKLMIESMVLYTFSGALDDLFLKSTPLHTSSDFASAYFSHAELIFTKSFLDFSKMPHYLLPTQPDNAT